jgi:hypothetical protein
MADSVSHSLGHPNGQAATWGYTLGSTSQHNEVQSQTIGLPVRTVCWPGQTQTGVQNQQVQGEETSWATTSVGCQSIVFRHSNGQNLPPALPLANQDTHWAALLGLKAGCGNTVLAQVKLRRDNEMLNSDLRRNQEELWKATDKGIKATVKHSRIKSALETDLNRI